MALVGLALLALACSGGDDDQAEPRSTYRLRVESIALADELEGVDGDAADVGPPDSWTIDVDSNQARARVVQTITHAVACPPDDSAPDEPVELELVHTADVTYSRTTGCSPDHDVWRETSNPFPYELLIPDRIDLDDPRNWLQRTYGQFVDEQLRMEFSTDCARAGSDLCAAYRSVGADPALLAESGIVGLVLDVDLGSSGLVETISFELRRDGPVDESLAGFGGVRYHVVDYGAPIDIALPDVDG